MQQPRQSCVRCGAQEGVIGIELAGVNTTLCLECSDVLTRAAAHVAGDIAERAQEVAGHLTDHTRSRGTTLDRPFHAWIAFEIAFFFLHLSDRQAFEALNEGPRVVFSRSLMDEVVPRLLSLLGLTRETARYNDVRQQVISTLNSRQLQYGERDAATVFVQFRTQLDKFFRDVAPNLHSDLTAVGFAQATDVWGTLAQAVRQRLATIARSNRGSPQHSATAPRAESPVPQPVPPPAQATSPRSGNYVARLWRGDVPLPATFWGWGFGLNVVFTLVLAATAVSAPDLFAFLRAVYLAYYAFMVVAIWRSSERYTGDRVWGYSRASLSWYN